MSIVFGVQNYRKRVRETVSVLDSAQFGGFGGADFHIVGGGRRIQLHDVVQRMLLGFERAVLDFRPDVDRHFYLIYAHDSARGFAVFGAHPWA